MYIAYAKLVSATLAAFAFVLLSRATRAKAFAREKFIIGWVLAVAFMLPFKIPLMRVELPESAASESFFESEAPGGAPLSPAPPESPEGEGGKTAEEKNSFPAEAAVTAVYALGASITLFCILYRYCRAVKFWRRCGRAPSARQGEIFARLCQKHGFRKSPSLLVCPEFALGSSVTFGITRQTVLIADKFAEEDFALILEHELTHCKRKDAFFKAVLTLLCSLYWFNPIMHLFIREMNDICEQSCDEKLLKNSGFEEKKRYCVLLVETALSNSAEKKFLFSAFRGGKNAMKQRITNILGKKSKVITAVLVVSALLITVLTSAIYLVEPQKNVKVAHLRTPEKVCEALNSDDIIQDYSQIEYNYSTGSDKVKVSGTVMGKPFDITATFASPSYNGARIVYTAEDSTGNYFVQLVKFEFAQNTEAVDLPIVDHNVGEHARHKFNGFFKDFAAANPQYKNALEVYLTPIDESGNVTDEVILIEIFIEEDFITDYIKANNSKCVDEIAQSEIERWYTRWYTKYNLWNYKPTEK